MKTLICYSQTLTDTHCQCIGVENGQLDSALPLAYRELGEIGDIAKTHQLCFIVPQTQCSLQPLELSWLSEKKARMAFPYALEDQCSQPIEQLHFAYNKAFYTNGCYLILCCETKLLQELIEKLEQAGLQPQLITTDWFALKPQSNAFVPDYVLIHQTEFKGALPYSQLDFINKETEDIEDIVFVDSPAEQIKATTAEADYQSKEWVAKEINTRTAINLLQGPFAQAQNQKDHQRAYVITAGIAVLWLMSLFASNLWQWHQLQKQNQKLEENIATVYREFFPDATRVISPRFRIAHALKNSADQQSSTFWKIYQAVTWSLKDTPLKVESLHYNGNSVTLNINTDDFATLESLQTHLKRYRLKVKQNKAATKDSRITASLELRL